MPFGFFFSLSFLKFEILGKKTCFSQNSSYFKVTLPAKVSQLGLKLLIRLEAAVGFEILWGVQAKRLLFIKN